MNLFADDEETTEVAFDRQETTGINFNTYEDKLVVVSGDNVTPPVSIFAEIDLGDENTPVGVSHASHLASWTRPDGLCSDWVRKDSSFLLSNY